MQKTESNGYTYTVYDNGTTKAEGILQDEKASRDGIQYVEVGGSAKEANDQKGHLIGARFNGSVIKENLHAQDAGLNQSQYKKVENNEMNLIRNHQESSQIYTEKIAYISNKIDTGMRPDAYLINDTITYGDGRTQHVNLSFTNISSKEQEQLNEASAGIVFGDSNNPGDVLREEMSTAEYTSLMEETDEYLSNIKDEFTEQIEVSYETTEEIGYSLAESPSYGEYSNSSENETEGNESCGNDMGDNSDYEIGDN